MVALDRLRLLVGRWAGIDVERGGQRHLLEKFVARRVGTLGLPSTDAFVEALSGPSDPEVLDLLDALTVGHTWFFREPAQLRLVETLLRTAPARSGPLDVWVPGCATGEDAYTVAMLASRAGRDVRIVGSDLNREAIARAHEGRYARWSVRELPRELRHHFRWDDGLNLAEVGDSLREHVSFLRHNLMDPPLRTQGGACFDLVVCRNVLIYFFPDSHARALERLASALVKGGSLVLGGSELVAEPPPELTLKNLDGRFVLERTRVPALHGGSRPPSAAPPPAPTQTLASMLSTAYAHLRAGDSELAETVCRDALELEPASPVAQLYLGIALHLQKDVPRAAQALRRAVAAAPNLWPAGFYLGLCCERLGLREEAKGAYGRALGACRDQPEGGGIDPCEELELWRHELLAAARRLNLGQAG